MRRAEKYTPRYTYSEWLHWEERGELIEGIPIEKSKRIGPKHEKAKAKLKEELALALTKAMCKGFTVGDPIDYKITNETILKPDIFIVAGKINKSYLDFPAVIIAEIVSKSTEERDRGIKYRFYEQQGVKYYLIIDAMKKVMGIYELVEGKYQLQPYQNDFQFQLNESCKMVPELDNIWE